MRSKWAVNLTAVVVSGLAIYFFLAPAGLVISELNDPGLRSNQIPRFAFSWHRQLSKKIERWARARVESGKAKALGLNNVSGTEWPMYTAVFYLWSTVALQEEWDKHPHSMGEAPKIYARPAIEAAAALIHDPNNANWVKLYWNDKYLTQENLFYRMLLISGLADYQRLLDRHEFESELRAQVETLAQEIDRSPYGLLDDYPGQCYPIDILPALAVIRRADAVLGTDNSKIVQRGIRAFQDGRLDPKTGLPAYICDSRTGLGRGSARGVEMSLMLTWSRSLWPELSDEWYARYEELFWQRGFFLAGFREFPKEAHEREWQIEVDAGPVISGYGTAASGFGIGAARANGRFDQAFALSAEALAISWPLPDGTRLAPRVLSNLSDAPYVGEAVLLFALTRHAETDVRNRTPGSIPFVVPLIVLFYASMGVGIPFCVLRRAGRWKQA